MNQQAVIMGPRGQRSKLMGRVERAQLGGLREGKRADLGKVHAIAALELEGEIGSDSQTVELEDAAPDDAADDEDWPDEEDEGDEEF